MTKLVFISIVAAAAFIGPGMAETYNPKFQENTVPFMAEVTGATEFKDVATGKPFKLYGVEGCAVDQMATAGKQKYLCGVQAMGWLITATLYNAIICTPVREDDGVMVARCATGQYPDIAAAMLEQGLVVMSPKAEDQLIADYAKVEGEARKKFLGLWRSEFEMPWTYAQSQQERQ
jgi:endonuclease YncB( thermonuclease family)